MTSAPSVYTREQVEQLRQAYGTALDERDQACLKMSEKVDAKNRKISEMVFMLNDAATSLADFQKLKKTNTDLNVELDESVKELQDVVNQRNYFLASSDKMTDCVRIEHQTRTSALELALKTIETLVDGGTNVSRHRTHDLAKLDLNASDIKELSRESGGGGTADLNAVPSADDQAKLRKEARAAMIASKQVTLNP
jgi:uncharacterized coiled-coil DUF342 family protein